MAGSGGALDPLVAAEVEVELRGVGDPNVHSGARRDVARLLLLIHTGQSGRYCIVQTRGISYVPPCVMSLLHYDERDRGLVVGLQLYTGLSYGCQLVLN